MIKTTLPNYDGQSVVNIPATILTHFGCESPNPPNLTLEKRLEGSKKVVFLFVDGFGYHQLEQDKAELPFFSYLMEKGQIITACFPSTTAATVASFATALTPAEHGIMGYNVLVRELGGLTNMLKYVNPETGERVNVDTDKFFPFKNVGESLAEKNVSSCAIIPPEIIDTELNKMTMRGAEKIGYPTHSMKVFFETVQNSLTGLKSKFIQAYLPLYDMICHEFGPLHDISRSYLMQIDKMTERFSNSLPKDTALIISADHGHIQTDPSAHILYSDHPKLLEMLECVGGESRMNYLYCKDGRKEDVKSYFCDNFQAQADIIESSQAFTNGYLGKKKPYELTISRLGDFIVLPKNNLAIGPKLIKHHGMHGGLSQFEMLVPLLTFRK